MVDSGEVEIGQPFFQQPVVTVEIAGQRNYVRAHPPERVMPLPVPRHDDSLVLIVELVRCQVDDDSVLLRPRMMLTVAPSSAVGPLAEPDVAQHLANQIR